MAVTSSNKRIVKNSLFLYLRMIIIMVVNFFTIREIMKELGVVDYGIYNVVGGIVLMFAFINSTLSSSSQRFFSVELAKGNLLKLRQCFCLNITMFLFLALIVVFLCDTVGLWFLNTHLTIPTERLYATNILFQISLLTFIVNMLTIPFNALIIAHEEMNVYAYLSIVEAVGKLLIIYVIGIVPFDRLVAYGVLLFMVALSIFLFYVAYCYRKYAESHYKFYWNKTEAKELFAFSGWHFLGTVSMVIRSNGINILLNMFFNPAVNAARAVAFQVNNAVHQLSANFFTAVKPQIYSLYTLNEIEKFRKLIFISTTMSFFLVSLIVMPIICETDYILNLWLKNTPEYAVLFTQLVLINGLIDCTNGPTIAATLATGRIRTYQIVVSILIFANLPISYIALKLGAGPEYTMIISISLSLISAITRVVLLNRLVSINLLAYFILFIKLAVVAIISYVLTKFFYSLLSQTIINFCLGGIVSVILQTLVYYFCILSREERQTAKQFISKFINKFKH